MENAEAVCLYHLVLYVSVSHLYNHVHGYMYIKVHVQHTALLKLLLCCGRLFLTSNKENKHSLHAGAL